MGAWGSGVFENDDAWIGVRHVLSAPSGVELLRTMAVDFCRRCQSLGYDDAFVGGSVADVVLALAELVAAAAGHPSAEVNEDEELSAWPAANSLVITKHDVELMLQCVEMVMKSRKVKELWEGERDAVMTDLLNRLSMSV